MYSMEKVVKCNWQEWLWWWVDGKNINNNSSGQFMPTLLKISTKFTWNCVIKFLPSAYCHSHFFATQLDFTTFLTLFISKQSCIFFKVKLLSCGYHIILNKAHAMASCGHTPGFLKLFSEKFVSLYVWCMYVCLYFRTLMIKPLSCKVI